MRVLIECDVCGADISSDSPDRLDISLSVNDLFFCHVVLITVKYSLTRNRRNPLSVPQIIIFPYLRSVQTHIKCYFLLHRVKSCAICRMLKRRSLFIDFLLSGHFLSYFHIEV